MTHWWSLLVTTGLLLSILTTLFEAGVRLPMLVRLPGSPPGLINPNLVSFIDTLPTFLDWAGHSEIKGMRKGRSFLPIIAHTER